MCQLSKTTSVSRFVTNQFVKLSAATNSMSLKRYYIFKMASENTRKSQNMTVENTLKNSHRLFPKCFFRYSNLCVDCVSVQKCSHCPPTYQRAEEIVDRDLQGFSRDIMMCSRWAMWACVTDL